MAEMDSTSAGVRRGLPSTAVDTSLLGSRMRMDRSSRVPLRAVISLSLTFIR